VKKLLQILGAAIISTAFIGSFASAATCDGTISVTGPGSNNTINCTNVSNIVLTCTNNVIVGSVNTQTGTSGNSNTSNNTSAGNAATGQVVNDNGNNVTIGASCGDTQVAANETPGRGEAGGGEGAAGGLPEVLPDTATAPIAPLVAASVASAAAVVGLSRFVVTAYRHLINR
jgi:hypothetical protein